MKLFFALLLPVFALSYSYYLIRDDKEIIIKTDIEFYSPVDKEYEQADNMVYNLNQKINKLEDDALFNKYFNEYWVIGNYIEISENVLKDQVFVNNWFDNIYDKIELIKILSEFKKIPDFSTYNKVNTLNYDTISRIALIYVLKAELYFLNNDFDSGFSIVHPLIDVLIKINNDSRFFINFAISEALIHQIVDVVSINFNKIKDPVLARNIKESLQLKLSIKDNFKRIIISDYCAAFGTFREAFPDSYKINFIYNRNITINKYGEYLKYAISFINKYDSSSADNPYLLISDFKNYWLFKNYIGNGFIEFYVPNWIFIYKEFHDNNANIEKNIILLENHIIYITGDIDEGDVGQSPTL